MHDLPVHEALLMLETDRDTGLDDRVARARLEQFGPNELARMRRRGPVQRMAAQFMHPLVYVLLVAAAVSAAVGHGVDASVIVGVVLVNAIIGFVQEARSEQALAALEAMVTGEARVRRNGRVRAVPVPEIVPGDVLLLAAGDAVAADTRLIDVADVQIDESALTGESQMVSKHELVLEPDTAIGDQINMAFAGTLVTRGSATGVVVATGGNTELGLIHRLTGSTAETVTPLTAKIAQFSRVLTVVILGLAVSAFLIGLARGDDPADLLVAAVALAVGAIPEGLPAAMTITLAIGVGRMARVNAIVRRLPAVETLGSTTVICSDKTGTLTENQMTVAAVLAGGEQFTVSGAGYAPEGTLEPASPHNRALQEVLLAGVLCNDAELHRDDGHWTVVGDPTEGALITAAEKGGIRRSDATRRLPRLDEIPFRSELQYMATLHEDGADGPVVYVKGAVERVLDQCSTALESDGSVIPLDRDAIHDAAVDLAHGALRVLAFARTTLDPGTRTLEEGFEPRGLTFLGLQGMIDPPRAEAITAVAACRRAGIAVKMITGDHARTAHAIAERVGISERSSGDGDPHVVTGRMIATSSDEQLRELVRSASVFARVSPEQKLRLVDALQAEGETVAMTGDGVNDAPALKRADIGVAMGDSGTDVAREAADIVLTDDNFASIERAVEEGRRTFDNLTKFIVWTLPTNLGEGFVILAAIIAGATLPILPVQILWINMTTAVALGLMLAFERAEPGIMDRPPRDRARPLLNAELMGRILLVGTLLLAATFGLFAWEQGQDRPLDESRTVAVNVFVMIELFYLFNCRSLQRSMFRIGVFSNAWVTVGVTVTIVLQMLFTYAAPMHELFGSASIGLEDWARILVLALVAWGIVGIEKTVRSRRAAVPPGARR